MINSSKRKQNFGAFCTNFHLNMNDLLLTWLCLSSESASVSTAERTSCFHDVSTGSEAYATRHFILYIKCAVVNIWNGLKHAPPRSWLTTWTKAFPVFSLKLFRIWKHVYSALSSVSQLRWGYCMVIFNEIFILTMFFFKGCRCSEDRNILHDF